VNNFHREEGLVHTAMEITTEENASKT